MAAAKGDCGTASPAIALRTFALVSSLGTLKKLPSKIFRRRVLFQNLKKNIWLKWPDKPSLNRKHPT